MLKRLLCLAVCVLFVAGVQASNSFYAFTLKSIDGRVTPLSLYKDKVVLLVNVASRCGFTPQYAGLQSLYEKYKNRGFVIVGIPSNNFYRQEPGTNQDIKKFCESKYHVTFPMMSKMSVAGWDTVPLYRFLTSKAANPRTSGEVEWNFTKFLIDRKGEVVGRFEPVVTPEDSDLIESIERSLK